MKIEISITTNKNKSEHVMKFDDLVLDIGYFCSQARAFSVQPVAIRNFVDKLEWFFSDQEDDTPPTVVVLKKDAMPAFEQLLHQILSVCFALRSIKASTDKDAFDYDDNYTFAKVMLMFVELFQCRSGYHKCITLKEITNAD